MARSRLALYDPVAALQFQAKNLLAARAYEKIVREAVQVQEVGLPEYVYAPTGNGGEAKAIVGEVAVRGDEDVELRRSTDLLLADFLAHETQDTSREYMHERGLLLAAFRAVTVPVTDSDVLVQVQILCKHPFLKRCLSTSYVASLCSRIQARRSTGDWRQYGGEDLVGYASAYSQVLGRRPPLHPIVLLVIDNLPEGQRAWSGVAGSVYSETLGSPSATGTWTEYGRPRTIWVQSPAPGTTATRWKYALKPPWSSPNCMSVLKAVLGAHLSVYTDWFPPPYSPFPPITNPQWGSCVSIVERRLDLTKNNLGYATWEWEITYSSARVAPGPPFDILDDAGKITFGDQPQVFPPHRLLALLDGRCSAGLIVRGRGSVYTSESHAYVACPVDPQSRRLKSEMWRAFRPVSSGGLDLTCGPAAISRRYDLLGSCLYAEITRIIQACGGLRTTPPIYVVMLYTAGDPSPLSLLPADPYTTLTKESTPVWISPTLWFGSQEFPYPDAHIRTVCLDVINILSLTPSPYRWKSGLTNYGGHTNPFHTAYTGHLYQTCTDLDPDGLCTGLGAVPGFGGNPIPPTTSYYPPSYLFAGMDQNYVFHRFASAPVFGSNRRAIGYVHPSDLVEHLRSVFSVILNRGVLW